MKQVDGMCDRGFHYKVCLIVHIYAHCMTYAYGTACWWKQLRTTDWQVYSHVGIGVVCFACCRLSLQGMPWQAVVASK